MLSDSEFRLDFLCSSQEVLATLDMGETSLVGDEGHFSGLPGYTRGQYVIVTDRWPWKLSRARLTG